MIYSPEDVNSWPYFKPLIIAHDVGRSRDHLTAVVGGNSPCGPRLVGIQEAVELPKGLFGHARASSLAEVDRRHHNNALIIADISNDITYGEVLQETFGQRVIGLHISRYGDGMNASSQPVRQGHLLVYTIGRTYLLELLLTELHNEVVRFADGRLMRRAYEQLVNLETEYRESGVVYVCPPGHHDDLGISCAMLVWAARHPHLPYWFRNLEAARRPRRPRKPYGWEAFT